MAYCTLKTMAVGMFLTTGLFAAPIVLTTNEVDRLLSADDGETFPAAERRATYVASSLSFRSAEGRYDELTRYFIDKLLDLNVTTNVRSVKFIGHFRDKAWAFHCSERALARIFSEDLARTILAKTADVLILPQSDLDRIRDFLDNFVGPKVPYCLPVVTPCTVAWQRHDNWNKAVADYRVNVVKVVVRLLNHLWKDVAEPERQARIWWLMAEYGFVAELDAIAPPVEK